MYCIYRVYHMEYIEYYTLNHIVLQISIQYINKWIFLGFKIMNSMTDMNDSWRLWCSVSWRIHAGQSNFGLSKTISLRNSRYCPGHVGSQYFFFPLWIQVANGMVIKTNIIHTYYTHWKCIIHIYHVLYQMLQSLKSQEEEGAGFNSTHGRRIWFWIRSGDIQVALMVAQAKWEAAHHLGV